MRVNPPGHKPLPLLDLIADKFTVGDDCWQWTGALNGDGYGRTYANGRRTYAHRILYELFKGPIPSGLQIDHLCRNRGCVRPSHLEAVTRRENLVRGEGFAGVAARKTHCPQGHEYSGDNLHIRIEKGGEVRKCRTCERERDRARWGPKRRAAQRIRQRAKREATRRGGA